MKNTKYLRCAKCGCDALPRKWNPQTGQLSETGTSTLMRCPDCKDSSGYASMCRDCCPTGHQTKLPKRGESMTVNELIASLQKLPNRNIEVLIDIRTPTQVYGQAQVTPWDVNKSYDGATIVVTLPTGMYIAKRKVNQ